MTTHEHPQYVTGAALEALEGRLINRLAEMETRITRDISTAFWRMVALVLPIYALVLAAILSVVIAGFSILGRLP